MVLHNGIWTPGTVSTQNGATAITDTNWLYSNMVDISAYSSVRFSHIQTTNGQTSLGFAFYTENQTFISGVTNGGTLYSPIEREIAVPPNAKYIRVMWINTTSDNYNETVHEISTEFYFYGTPEV